MIGRAIAKGLRQAAPALLISSSRRTVHTLVRYNKFVKPYCVIPVIPKQNYSSFEVQWTDEQFQSIMESNKLVVFMKGTPDSPQCGFSKYVCQILTMHGCENFLTFNVLEDELLRSRVKEFSNWPTVPQVYMDGEFIGGFDILLQLHQSGELIEELEKIGHKSALLDEDGKNDP